MKLVQKIGQMAVLLCLVMGIGMTRLLAQTVGSATLTISLSDVLQLTVNTNAVNLNFATAANYNNGVSSTVSNQLTVTSNRAYDLSVRAATPDLVNGINVIPIGNVAVQTVNLVGGSPKVISALTTTNQTLATGLPATTSSSVNIQYSTAAGNTAFLKPAGAYVTTLTFTVVAL